MSNVAKLKKEAADLEGKKQFEKALKVYVKLLGEFERYPQEIDVALFNRVGDIQIKLGQVAEGVATFETAVDLYADGGFFNNAIAMCNKILRQAPGRASIYYKLGKISAQKGFKAEARQNFLEYADRMEKTGNTNEAFRALTEFMELVPDQDDIRSMLADQLIKADRKPEAVRQLQALYERFSEEGKGAESDEVAKRIRALDPTVELSVGARTSTSSGPDLVFIDLDAPTTSAAPDPEPPPRPAPKPAAAKAPPAPPPPAAEPPLAPARRSEPVVQAASEPEPESQEMEITRASDIGAGLSAPMSSGLDIEPTSLGGGPADVPVRALEIEPTSFGEISLDPPAAPAAPVRRETPPPVEPRRSVQREPVPDEPRISMPRDVVGDEPRVSTPSVPAPKEPRPTSSLTFISSDPEPEAEPELLELTELPPTAIAPVIDVRATKKPEPSSLSFVDLDVIEPEPEPAPPPVAASVPPVVRPTAKSLPAVESLPDFDLAPSETDSAARKSTIFAAKAVNLLQTAVQASPENWSLRRELAEAMIEAGDKPGGIHELETAMNGADSSDDLELAMGIAEELGKLEPLVVKHHQKRVEYAFRRNDRPRLVEAYLTLADALMHNEQSDKARAVYQRVLELAPDNMQAQAAVETIAPPVVVAPKAAPARSSATTKRQSQVSPPAPPVESADGFVNLGDWLREDDVPKDTRMVVDEQDPTGDEDADFADMLKKFKQGVAENVDAEDYQSHYDLAIAFKEMGLLDEAIAGFQRALGSKTNRLPTYEALGECFIEKKQPKMAAAILQRAMGEQATEDQLVGVLYLLGRAAEEQGQGQEALDYYQRVMVTDIRFRDISARMSALEQTGR